MWGLAERKTSRFGRDFDVSDVYDQLDTLRGYVQLPDDLHLTDSRMLPGYLLAGLPILLGLVVYTMNREYMNILFTEPIGRMMITERTLEQTVAAIEQGGADGLVVGGEPVAVDITFEQIFEPPEVAPVFLAGLRGTQTIDGVAVVSGDRVLVKDQTDGTENGVWIVAGQYLTETPGYEDCADVADCPLALVVLLDVFDWASAPVAPKRCSAPPR